MNQKLGPKISVKNTRKYRELQRSEDPQSMAIKQRIVRDADDQMSLINARLIYPKSPKPHQIQQFFT